MMQVTAIPAFTDNYIWLIGDDTTHHAAIVDPGDAAPVLAALEHLHMQPVAILITHHHRDHVGGIEKLLEAYPGLAVYGPINENIPHLTHPLGEGDTVALESLGLSFSVMELPGHTVGHIVYYGEGSLFCGDTLFANGCGRVFGSTLSDLYHSLQRIAALPADTQVYCTHEYTVDNIGFAKWVEPDNAALDARMEECWALLDAGHPTVPFELGREFDTNPFLRTHIPEVIAKAEEIAGRETQTPEDVFAVLRIWKDTEYD
jgi:hydroxyacylglutathione hydrolase